MTNINAANILVVDDNASWLDLIKSILESDGYSVKTASNFGEGEQILESEIFDLAILDVRLTGTIFDVQGVTLLQIAKKIQPSIKAIILTGYPDADQRRKAIDFFHADGYFEKAPGGQPLDIKGFSDLIYSLLNPGKSSQEDENYNVDF